MLEGKRALVIGGGGNGIGRAVTRAFGRAGAQVAVADLVLERATEAADEVIDAGGTAFALAVDVRDPAAIAALVTEAAERLGGLDVLVTVVGGQVAFVPTVRLHEMTDQDWDTVYELNLRWVARAVRAALGVFLGQGTGGAVVSVGSVVGFMGAPGQGAYGAAKAGLASLARTVAAEYAAEGVRMNVVACGAIATGVYPGAGDGAVVPEIPVGRYGTAAEAADAVVYLSSDAAAYVTGQQLVVDGGVSVRGPFG